MLYSKCFSRHKPNSSALANNMMTTSFVNNDAASETPQLNGYSDMGLYDCQEYEREDLSSSTAVESEHTAECTSEGKFVNSKRRDSMVPWHESSSVRPIRTHRRMASYPVRFDETVLVMEAGSNPLSLRQALEQCSVLATKQHNGASIKCHRRSHSHESGRRINTPFCGIHHGRISRWNGTSVIETLQTLSCSGSDLNANDKQTNSVLQFLETLKKEQKQRCEKRELNEMQDELVDLRDCGFGKFRPSFLQYFASVKVFVFLLALLVMIQQALSSGYFNSVITTIEKRFEIPSSISGVIASMYEIGNLITIVFVSYLGSRRHIPSWIGIGAIVMGVASILFALPNFLISDDYHGRRADINTSNICSAELLASHSSSSYILNKIPGVKQLTQGLPSVPAHNNKYDRQENCFEKPSGSTTLSIVIFMISQFLLGCGGSPLFTLGTTFIDNHVKKDSSSMYISVMYSMSAFGPVCGFLLGAYLLSHNVDTFSTGVSDLTYDSTDRRWVGMWWFGFFICGTLLIIFSIPFFFFPKELKKEKVKVFIDDKYHQSRNPSICPRPPSVTSSVIINNINTDVTTTKKTLCKSLSTSVVQENRGQKEYGKDIKDIPQSMWRLISNKIYFITCMGTCMQLFIVSGFIVFLPKYLETQFNLSKSQASMFTGAVAIPSACIGIILGGYLLKRLKLDPKGAITFVIFACIMSTGCLVVLFFLGCDNIKMAGTTTSYSNRNDVNGEPFKINLTSSCNLGCKCDMNDVHPVCGANGLTYFSPCHAGCTNIETFASKNYTNCACVVVASLNVDQNSQETRPTTNPIISSISKSSDSRHSGKNIDFAGVTTVPVATAGPCHSDCNMFLPFMVLLFFITLIFSFSQMPVLMVVLRSVKEEEKSFALGIQFVFFRLFAYIPSPILFGNLIDSTCILWKSSCSGEANGLCLLYDIEAFRFRFIAMCFVVNVISVIIFICDWWLIARRQRKEYKLAVMTVGEVVNSVISLDTLYDPVNGPHWVVSTDEETGFDQKVVLETSPNVMVVSSDKV